MSYEMKPLTCNPGALSGLSEKIIVSHYENNYGGAVKRLNAIEQELAELDWATAPVFVVNGLKREELIASNSMILHELYFDSLGASPASAGLLAQLQQDFGGMAQWAAQFAAMGKAQGGGSGWVLLAWSARDNKLINTWASDHTCNLAGATPILALDMYEHSYHMDFGAKAAAYVEAFMNNLNLAAASSKLAALKGA
ncbi:MAG: superoxide dismutase [Hydrogenophilales bacterium 12-61-10]|jgi:Fe-Mn family superoxide dismutase|nr:MAG: superoxide dismutase [Hydrogenophilales bacterium 12-61-10]OYX28077.1 MAG: superoxide dismutase [Hydrogenophilales bacterium 32-62-9]OYY59541.1 MAG: superoxide dismutase [Hydrogenophilales bacterium 28-61-11]OZA45433.1 MAG: superoxide dismutase [Hydrogenophilales bacterium 17-61-76]